MARLVLGQQPERNGDDEQLLESTQERHADVESLPKLTRLWQYNWVVTAPLADVLSVMQRLAPLAFAEAWDNVGLLLEPVAVTKAPPVADALLTIDLSEDVVTEAVGLGASLIVAYHPPIFSGLKRLCASSPAQRTLLLAAAAGICVYSPHTALDAVPDGVNDWLLDAFGSDERERAPCIPHATDSRYGAGRYVHLATPISLSEAVLRVKRHLGLKEVRVATAAAHAGNTSVVRSIAVCAGAGGSVFEKLSGFDLFVTGEMRHHDVRGRTLDGSSVILSEHTHTERGYLRILAERLTTETNGNVTFHVSQCDRDPLVLV